MLPITNNLILLAPAAPADPNATGSFGGLLFYIGVAIGVSFLCSVLEAILLSSSHTYIEGLIAEGSSTGILMQKHKSNVDVPIAAILTLNTFAHTIGAAGAGAEATAIFGSEFFGIISAVLTLMILIFSEIIPKTIGAVYWKQLLPFAAYTIRIMVIVLFPMVWLLQKLTNLIQSEQGIPTITRTEIEAMASIGADEGAIGESESRMMTNLLHLNRVQIGDIMTPRTVMFALHQNMTVKDVLVKHRVLPYSRIPIYNESLDDIQGFVLRHEILLRAAKHQEHDEITAFKRELHYVPETLTVAKAMEEFVNRQEHMFLVFDEYGGTAGIITMEDAIESLLGAEITDESDIAEDLRKVAQERNKRQMGFLNAVMSTTDNMDMVRINGDTSSELPEDMSDDERTQGDSDDAIENITADVDQTGEPTGDNS